MSELRVRFHDDTLKDKLVAMSKDLDIATNQLVEMILAAEFDDKSKRSLQLLRELADFKKRSAGA